MKSESPVCRGYARAVGRPGIRNKLLIVYTVECSQHICREIAKHFDYSHIVDVIGNEACASNEVVFRQLSALVQHPNVGAVLVVTMGCEETDGAALCALAEKAGRSSAIFSVQDSGGTEKSIEKGCQIAADLIEKLSTTPTVDLYWRDLCIGVECGSSDYTSLIAANPLAGAFVDMLVGAGGAAVIGELTEMVGQRDSLMARAVNQKTAGELDISYRKMMEFCAATKRFSISRGNFMGGLSTIEEKSAGALAKSGSVPINGVLKIAQTVPASGLWIVDEFPDFIPNPDVFRGGDASSMMNLICAGCQLVFLTTGRGHIAGTPVSPAYKLTGNHRTYTRMSDDIDFDASVVLQEGNSIDGILSDFVHSVSKILCGHLTNAERHGVSNVSLPFNFQKEGCVIDRLYY